MNNPTIAPLVFEALQANAGADFVLQLVEAFAEEAPRLTQQLRAAAETGDATQFETIAHSLKSNGVTFGALRLTEMAARLEWQGLAADSAAIEVAIAELVGEVAAIVPILRAVARQ
ncbi:Hpt domain-containing protein [Roseateles oligotrophus]|uniref:Hpt domain-containing protein n=1 Tax=Roseateles oligotrophus TaxID=1769250 RepID=A0ABT2Y9X1_9BURK|nr:Hpt domain-containing protein [Roseateles oligotrophus]MCV2367068.1 Hpt domain-containing protein [Roseateles oligotrophus]